MQSTDSSSIVATPSVIRRRKIVLCGFFGRGNVGDEAFLHAQVEALSPHFDIVIAVDRNGARQDCVNWNPYNQHEIWGYDDFTRVYDEQAIYGVHVGGGSLPFSFAAQFVSSSIDSGKAVVFSGVDMGLHHKSTGYNYRLDVLKYYSLLAVRSAPYFTTLKHASNTMHGADWALGLHPNPSGREIDVALTIRESDEITSERIEYYRSIVLALEAAGRHVTFVPFSPEDDRLLDQMSVPVQRREVHWHDPRTVLSRIGMSKSVVSVGRLHTAIFALMAHKPVASIDPRITRNGVWKPNFKNQMAAKVYGFQHYSNASDFIADLDAFNSAEPTNILSETMLRFDQMRDSVVSAFMNHRIPPQGDEDITKQLLSEGLPSA